MYFITTKRMLEVCFFQHTPTFIIEPNKKEAFTSLPNFLPLTYSASENLGMTVKVSFLSYLIHYFFMDSITHSCFFVLLS